MNSHDSEFLYKSSGDNLFAKFTCIITIFIMLSFLIIKEPSNQLGYKCSYIEFQSNYNLILSPTYIKMTFDEISYFLVQNKKI